MIKNDKKGATMGKIISLLAGTLLGVFFIVFGLNFFFNFMEIPPPKEDLSSQYITALYSSGYLNIIKVLEIVGGVFILFPITRRIGLTILTPIVVNIVIYKQLFEQEVFYRPLSLIMIVLTGIIILVEWRAITSFLLKK